MKKQFLSAKTLMLAALILVVSGCTIKHKFEQPPLVVNNYYEGGGDSGSGENNTLSTADLGVGYDITRADPYIWANNSVKGVAIRPKVFTFLPDPDPNQTVDLGKLNRDATRRRKPLGVNVDASPEFTWEEKMDFVSDASDFQTSNGGHVSVEGGAMGVAFSASASFKSAQEKNTKEDKTVASKNGAYKALKMEIDFSTPHQFTKQFRDAVQNLNQNPRTYDTFIYNWGTHFSRVATIGANCAYRMEFKNSALSTKYESEESFKAGVEGSMAGISAEVSAGYDQSRMNEIKKETGAESITFVSYGGSGAGINDYPKWTEHAVENPTLIDVYLTPYDSLFTKAFFPKDDLIKKKQELMNQALLRYYDSQGKTIGKLPKKRIVYLGMPQAQTFEVTATFLRVIKGYKEETNNQRKYGSVTHIGVYDGVGGTIQETFVYNLNGDGDNYIKQGGGKGLIRGDKLELTDNSFTITLQPDQLAGAFVSITGSMTLSSKSMGDKYPEKVADEEKIPLSDFLPDETKNKFVTFKHTDPEQGDVVEIHFKVTRIPNKVVAMTAIDTMLYIVEANNLYSFDPKRGSYKWLNREYAGTWSGVAAMTAIDETLYIVQGDKLYPVVKPYTSYQPPIASAVTWDKVDAMTAIGKTLYIAQGDYLYSVDSQNGLPILLIKRDNTNTGAMTAIGKTLYIVKTAITAKTTFLYSVVPPYNSYDLLSEASWVNTTAMTAIEKTLYIVQNKNLYSVNQAGGFLQLNTANNTWVNVVDMTAIGKTLYIIQGYRLYSVVPPYNSYEPLNK